MMMPVRSDSSYSSTFGFVSHRLLTVIVAFGQVMGAAAATMAIAKAAATMAVAKVATILAVAKAAAILAIAKTTRRMIRTRVGEKRRRVGMRSCRMTMGIRLRMT